MATILCCWLLGVGSVAAEPADTSLERYQAAQVHMGVLQKIVLYAPDKTTANRALDAAFSRIAQIDRACTNYGSESELIRLCKMSPTSKGVAVGDDLWNVLAAAQDLSRRTDGQFDVTIGPLTKLWRRARVRKQAPSPERLAEAKEAVGHQFMQLDADDQTVQLTRPGMLLDLGGIAKGYAADEALAAIRQHGVTRAAINAGGDITLGDPPPDRAGWKIGIAPLEPKGPPSRMLLLSNCSVATSGDAWQFIEIDGRRFSHIVDPRTGLGLTDRSSVSVVARTGMAADSLASAVSVLGPEQGLKLIEQTCAAAALIVRAPEGEVETHESSRFQALPRVAEAE